MAKYIFTFTIILLAGLSRLLPHPPNVSPITALALFGAVYLDRKHAFTVPLIAMMISDYFIGFHSEIFWVYGSFILVGFIGLWLRGRHNLTKTIGATLAGSVIFFLVTNFGVWLGPMRLYPQTFAGLIECYTAAIPFFRNSVIGDLFYVGAMFSIFEISNRLLPSLRLKPSEIQK